MKIEKKEKYTLVSSDDNSFSSFYESFLENLTSLKKEHLVLQISENLNVKTEEILLFLSITEEKKENGTSFVIVKSNINMDDFPENFNIAPTLIEAEDILEMEAMERELGF
ncbi:hypothetical protein BW723_17430 [Polaribacter reichenbachii]|uniref:Uncharacterized protein n=1 Tax=Polaribacter reichenbachii TaxID=996801 RepID=A0A1B8U4U6_9FLAO|nr:hypothetical protein [Polaribacter reichenbachii]APZ47969.1 hypothetical protein BW723_17430 [Polaribacter reichenbachii]AUC18603.1 hypothetical protein BTO17_07840 [Polaribacter reichenbachii]OBY66898.1 hypothetical protein LPB301_04735 [Polaribacter reichenbachii]